MRGGIAGLLRRIWGDSSDSKAKVVECRKSCRHGAQHVAPLKRAKLGGGFGAEDALETRAGELDTDELFSNGLRIGNMDDAAMGGEVRVASARSVMRKRDADFEVGADGDVEMRHESSSVAADIFAGSIFFEGKAAGVAPPDFEGQAYCDSTFRALPRYRGAGRDHGLGPPFW
jgi:hypothetical protein